MAAAPPGTLWLSLTDASGAEVARATVDYDPATKAVTSLTVENGTAGTLPLEVWTAAGLSQHVQLQGGTTTSYTAQEIAGWGITVLADFQGITISTPG